MIWTAFKTKGLDKRAEVPLTPLYFLQGDENGFNEIDLKTDWRFCEVKGKRKEAVLIGDVELNESDFPITFPLVLRNGLIVLNKEGHFE